MTSETIENERVFVGLLECPLRKGFIEFEYHAGDTIEELKQGLSKAWGQPDALGRSLGRDDWHGGLTDWGAWAILCEDGSGAYVALSSSSLIPQTPPATSEGLRSPRISPNPSAEWNLPAGLVYDSDIEEILYTMRVSEGAVGVGRPHLDLGFVREYEVPESKEYSVRLLALVVITGG